MKRGDEILDLYRQRVTIYGPMHQQMRNIQAIYHDRAHIPLPDMDRDEPSSVPNLLAQGVDQMAGRITSVAPQVAFSSVNPGNRRADRRAATAARTINGWWQEDRLPMKMRQRGRHILAYGMAPVVIRWDAKNHQPTWHIRHPLETFPSTDVLPGQVQPTDCIFAFRRSVSWMKSAGYMDHLAVLVGRENITQDASILLIEYVDCDETVLMAVSYAEAGLYMSNTSALRGVELERYSNGTEECPVVIPSRISLDGRQGQFDNMVGMYYTQARLMALEVIAVEKGIFPDTTLVSRPGEVARFVDGPHDGRSGLVSIISGGDIHESQPTPSYLTTQTIDRLERNQRVTSGIPAEFGGESGSNIRTGRRGDAVLSAVIDFPVAEVQETFAYALTEENEVAIDLAKRIDGGNTRTIYVGTGNARSPVTYEPYETFVTEEHTVFYPAAGSDMNMLMTGLGQRVGIGTMSRRTAAELDPFIDNPEAERDLIIGESLEQALLQSIQQKAVSGELPPLALAKLMRLVTTDKMELAEAAQKVTEDAMKEQRAAETPDQMTPDQAMAPGAVGALAGPQSPIPGPAAGQQDLSSLLNTLRSGSRSPMRASA